MLTLLDHDANFSPWHALEERGVVIRRVAFRVSDCTLDMQDLVRQINQRTKVVAVGYASNAVGTVNDVKEVVRLAHAAGALAYIDAVHYAPHGPIDVRGSGLRFSGVLELQVFRSTHGSALRKARALEEAAALQSAREHE